jgi:choline dehydrogenase-like flavoprotein
MTENVLVIEYGVVEYAPGQFDPPQSQWGFQTPGPTDKTSRWSFQSLPNPNINNMTASVAAGQVVGGSSAINGQFFDRPSRFDFDAWRRAGSPEFDSREEKWDWDGIYPYFKKVRHKAE